MASHQWQQASAAVHDQDGLRIWSCVTCRRRKVKCDRRDPCANCVRNNIECHFPVTGRLPRRSRDPTGIVASKPSSQRQAELLGRLRRLEDLVTELSGQLEDGTAPPAHFSSSTSSVSAPASKTSLGSTEDMYEDFGRLVVDQGGKQRVDRGFWSIFCDEVEHIFQAIQDDSHGLEEGRQESVTVNGPSTDDCHGYLFGSPCVSVTDAELYPLPSQVPFLWKAFVDNVDPFIKVLHVPSVEAIIGQAKGKLNALGPGVEALLFSICLAAIVSLDHDEVSDSFRVSRSEMISRFRLGTERALGHSQFAMTRDTTVVQALTVYLSTLPHIGSAQLACNLTGTLVRIATSMDLHKDGLDKQSPNLTTLEVETRRRLWWHICFIESRGSDPAVRGVGISEGSFTTRVPTNIHDQMITGTSTVIAEGTQQPTPTTLALVRCQIWRLRSALRRRRGDWLDLQLQKVRDSRAKIESAVPLDPCSEEAFVPFLRIMTDLFFAKIEREIYRQHLLRLEEASGSHTQGHFFASSVAVLDGMRELRTNPAWQKWRWQLQGSFPWRAVGSVFVQLCQLPWTPTSERAWRLARELLDGLPSGEKKEALWERVNGLAAKAAAHRDRQVEPRVRVNTASLDWNVVQNDEATVSAPEPTQAQEAQSSLIQDVLADSAALDWERDVYAVDDALVGWPDWDGAADMGIFD